MNKEVTYEIKQIDNINEDNIAFAIYSNKDNYNEIASIINLVFKIDKITFYESNDILNLEKNYSKVLYIYNDILNNNYKKTNTYLNIYRDEENTFNIYSNYERIISNDLKLKPYLSDVSDYNDAEDLDIDKELLVEIEELYAKEMYKRQILINSYSIRNNELYSYEGYEYSIIKNDIFKNNNIVEVINDNLNSKIKYQDLLKLKIDNLSDAYKEVYINDYFELTDEFKDIISSDISILESKIGKFQNIYSIDESEYDSDSKVNSFYIDFATWCLVFEKGLLIISYGSFE